MRSHRKGGDVSEEGKKLEKSFFKLNQVEIFG